MQRNPAARQPSPPHPPPTTATTARNNQTPASAAVSAISVPTSRLSPPSTASTARPSVSVSLLQPPPSTLHHSVSDSATLSSLYHSASHTTAHHIAHSPLPASEPPPPPSDSEWEECVVLRDGKRYPVAQHEKHITTAALFLIVYFCVTGGPYGLEDGVRSGSGGGQGGVGWVMVLMLVLPLTVHMPIALMTGELASSMPQNGGYILWVSRAFGNFWGFMEGWFSWCSATVDTALYPFLVIAYARRMLCVEWLAEDGAGVLVGHAAVTVLVALLNWSNWQLSGTPSLLLSILFLIPFFLISILGLSSISFSLSTLSLLFSFPALSQIHWGLTLSSILWVGSGWDSVGTVGNDVKRPKRTYPLAIGLSLLAVTATNVLPMLVAVLTDKQYADYDAMSGFWVDIGKQVGGRWLEWAVGITSVIGNLHMFNVLFTSSQWSLFALFLPGLLNAPSLLRLDSRHGTPTYPILITTLAVILCGFSSFDSLLQLAMAFNALALLLQCLALLHLRLVEPNMRRPYRVGLGVVGVGMLLSAPIFTSIVLLLTIDAVCQVVIILGLVGGVVSYYAARVNERDRRIAKDRAASSLLHPRSLASLPLTHPSHPNADLEYESHTSLPPQQEQQVNLAAVFEEVGDESGVMAGYRTGMQAEMLPDFVSGPSEGSGTDTGRRDWQALSDHREKEEKEEDEDEEQEDEADEERGEAGLLDALPRRLRFAPIRPLISVGAAGATSKDVDDEDDDSPPRAVSPVLLRSPKEKVRRSADDADISVIGDSAQLRLASNR